MKKVKQILALIGVIILVSLYIITLITAIFDTSNGMKMFEASIVATIIIPTLLWAYSFIYRLTRKNTDNDDDGKEK